MHADLSQLEQSNFEQPTQFVGRIAELGEILALLQDERCRLLTIVGVGGLGKTRLAFHVARQALAHFRDGVSVVALQPVQTRARFISAMADRLGLALSGQAPPEEQLLQFLQPKQLLLLLDNFEQLRHAADLLTLITRQTEAVKILVTSREALNLQEEWRYRLEGLPVPMSHETDNLVENDAVRLFLDRAQHVRPSFQLGDERAGVVRICQLVEGMPLALEMAAAWTKTMRSAEIAAEIQRSMTFLQSNFRDITARHRNMEAVFVQTWGRMPEAEQQLFKQLSVFRGGFDRAAAEAVAGATLPLLSSLLDRCLLRREATDRYHLHELLRQFAEQKLSQSEATAVAAAHVDYYTTFLAERTRGTVEHTQLETSRAIECELENIRAAWQYAVEHEQVDALAKAAAAYFYASQIQSHFLESAAASEQAVAIMGKAGNRQQVAQISVYWGWMLIRVGRFRQAGAVLEQSVTLFEELDLKPAYGMGSHPFAALTVLRSTQGRYQKAVALGETLKQQSIARGDQHNLAFACYGLTSTYAGLGQYELAQRNAQQATHVAQEVGNHWFQAYCLIEWGKSAVALEHYAEAKSHFRAALEIREGFDDPEGKAVILTHLAEIACVQKDYATAAQFCEESLTIYRNLNDQGGLASTLRVMGQIAVREGDPAQAAAYFRQALITAASIHFLPLVLSVLLNTAELLLAHRKSALGAEILGVIIHHPAATVHQRQMAQAQLGGRRIDTETLSPLEPDLEKLIMWLRSELADFVPRVPRDIQPLANPLTSRELDVLRLIASGLSNPEIADKLVVAVGTVKAHTNRIYSKLQVTNRVGAVERARTLNLLAE